MAKGGEGDPPLVINGGGARELQGKKVIILAEEMYNEFELWYPYYRLLEAGAEVVLVGSGSAQVYKSKLGLPVSVQTSADQSLAQQARMPGRPI